MVAAAKAPDYSSSDPRKRWIVIENNVDVNPILSRIVIRRTLSRSLKLPRQQEQKDHRDWIYEEDKRLGPYLRIVNETVTDDKVADLIKLCLTAKGTEEDYQRLEERFAT